MNAREQILAALKKLGPAKPRAIADHAGIDPQVLKKELKTALGDKVVKATGKTAGRTYALPDQKFDAAGATKAGRKKKKKGKRTKHVRAERLGGGVASPQFIPAVDADKRLILIDGDTPRIFSEEQTTAIATLLFQHYSA